MKDIKEKMEKIGDIIYNKKAIYIYILLFPFFEIITTYMLKQMKLDVSFGMIYKTLFIIYALGYLLFYSKTNKKLTIIYLSSLFVLAMLNIAFTFEGVNLEKITDIGKFFCYPVYILFFIKYFKDNNKLNEKVLVYAISIFAFSMLIAAITKTAYSTYTSSILYGQKGWFYSGNEISAIFAMLLPITIYYAVKKHDIKIWLCLVLILYGALSIGTKVSVVAVFITIFMMGIYGIIKIIIDKKDIIARRLIVAIFVISLGIYFYAPYSASIRVMIIKYDLLKWNISKNITKGKITAKDQAKLLNEFTMNGREVFLKDTMIIYKNSKIQNQLFGLESFPELEESNKSKMVERDFHDILFRYGIIGIIMFFIPTIVLILRIMRKTSKNILNELDYFKYASIISVFLGFSIAYIAGHVLLSPSVALFLTIIITSIETKNEDIKEIKKKEIGS